MLLSAISSSFEVLLIAAYLSPYVYVLSFVWVVVTLVFAAIENLWLTREGASFAAIRQRLVRHREWVVFPIVAYVSAAVGGIGAVYLQSTMAKRGVIYGLLGRSKIISHSPHGPIALSLGMNVLLIGLLIIATTGFIAIFIYRPDDSEPGSPGTIGEGNLLGELAYEEKLIANLAAMSLGEIEILRRNNELLIDSAVRPDHLINLSRRVHSTKIQAVGASEPTRVGILPKPFLGFMKYKEPPWFESHYARRWVLGRGAFLLCGGVQLLTFGLMVFDAVEIFDSGLFVLVAVLLSITGAGLLFLAARADAIYHSRRGLQRRAVELAAREVQEKLCEKRSPDTKTLEDISKNLESLINVVSVLASDLKLLTSLRSVADKFRNRLLRGGPLASILAKWIIPKC